MYLLGKHDQFELEILNHVENNPQLTNRILASKLGCSIKLAHSVLTGMVDRGLLHVKKLHSRRWDYFLTPEGLGEKARLTYEFLDFSMRFYSEARKKSSQLCRDLQEEGFRSIAFLGAGDLAEIAYLGIKEWNLELADVYDDNKTRFLGNDVKPLAEFNKTSAEMIIVCLYETNKPMGKKYLPENILPNKRMRWIF